MDINSLKGIYRIKYSDDGEYLNNYIEELYEKSINDLLAASPKLREMYAGRAQIINEIKKFIKDVDTKIKDTSETDVVEWAL